ncbi:MAG: PLP-dependent aminotransferase family protein [Gluconacetobacter sp.]|uniref:PLP-dependent aminotransferase family protein n=1 Tax=Gluconacetobacter dulcium TaxID=2729096 RepID=A0A7W4PH61_9PROT|nr:PLP-dependent aminotransferase family protein [Gluconacetobacter dulcium]MBB2197273.1 PLP-dependent aminotransferase family protein [Gluconacetobacter dulcium]
MDGQQADGTRVAQVMGLVRHRIERRLLTPGARLPSIRAMAEAAGVSKSTVVEAYDRLHAEGAVRSRPGAGFYVAAPLAPLSLDVPTSEGARMVDPIGMLRASLEQDPAALSPGCGWLPAAWMPEDLVRRALRAMAREGSVEMLFDYDSPLGHAPIRAYVARRMAEQDIGVSPAQILTTDSGSHALDLICRFLLRPGDTVMVDDPCYFNFLALLRAHQVRVVGVPYLADGPDVAAFDRVAAACRPRLYITNAAIHNPTGAVLSPVVAHRVLRLAEAHDIIMVEDDIFADFEATPAARLATFDGLERVVRIGSFSKTVSAAFRCGYIAVRPDWVEGLVDLRVASSIASGRLAAGICHAVLTDSGYRRHVGQMRARLDQCRARVTARLKRLGLMPTVEPDSGPFLWCRLPEGLAATDVARRALAQGVILAPGNLFSADGIAADCLRFNVARMDDEKVYRVLAEAVGRPGFHPGPAKGGAFGNPFFNRSISGIPGMK